MDWIAYYIVVCCASKSSNHRSFRHSPVLSRSAFFAVSKSDSFLFLEEVNHLTRNLFFVRECYLAESNQTNRN